LKTSSNSGSMSSSNIVLSLPIFFMLPVAFA